MTHRPQRFGPALASALAVFCAALLAASAVHAAPTPGRYDGRLCVAARAAPPDCGPARIELRGSRLALVRISDLLYALTLQTDQVEVVLKHGAMQIDGFSAVYEWKGHVLHFVDADKGVRYEVQLGERRR